MCPESLGSCPQALAGATAPWVIVGQQSWRSAGLCAHLSNYFPFLRAAHEHLAHPPGCLAWIEAWAFFSSQTFHICSLVEDRPKAIAASAGTPPDPRLGPL